MCQYVPVLNDMFIVELKGMLDAVPVRACHDICLLWN